MEEQIITIHTEYITLDAFLKWAGVAETGGHAKQIIATGAVSVNGEPEQRRGRKLRPGDRVSLPGAGTWVIRREGE
ncbi:MAG: S4 domain-containing protein YaaA [Symbiobacterium sp.]|uniref:S4 domain-containing protein YaaA n=1 Tax=Symbiobacterium sp. TaxID=1971213 RepID=UPI00346425B4